MIQPGTYHTLKVGQPTDGGVLLFDGEQHAVFFPEFEYESTPVSGRYISVFVYQNNTGALTATLKKPLVVLGQAACLIIKSVTDVGAFADMGLAKDLFIPFKEQHRRMQPNERYIIALYLDEQSGRLTGSSRLTKHLSNAHHDLEEGMQVDVLIADETDLGVNVVINNTYLGLVYHNEFFKNIPYGGSTKGYIKALRPNDKIDVSLQKPGYEAIDEGADVLLSALESNKGFLPLSDKSAPEEIKARLGMSKKVFKKAVGQLYSQRIITLHEDGLRLTDSD